MIWLYRLQQRLSITRHEGLAVLTLSALFLVGLTVQHVQEQQIPPLEVDSLVVKSTGPSADSSEPADTSGPSPSAETPINVNTASLDALEALPGVGPVLAKRIDEYRSSQRRFQQVDELMRVSGIGSKTMETLRPMVRVTSPEEFSQ